VTLVTRIQMGVPSGVLRTHSADRHGAPSGVDICEYRIAVRRMDNTARASRVRVQT
jgi:hypothetical protein